MARLTTWDEDDEEVVLATGSSVGIGESVYGGGGYFFVDDVKRFAGDDAAQIAASVLSQQPDRDRDVLEHLNGR